MQLSVAVEAQQSPEVPVGPAQPVPGAAAATPENVPSPQPDTAKVTGVAGPDGQERSAEEARIEPPALSPAPPPPPPPAEIPSRFKLDVGGGFILFYNQPLKSSLGKGSMQVFEARVRVDAEFGMFGLHILPIARDSKERAFFPGTAWVQEAYAFARLTPYLQIKAGKVFAQFGRFWDNSFYGNVQEYDGFKLDPNNGVSIEGTLAATERLGFTYFAQYFVTDGETNYSLPGRDTLSIPGARRRNYLVGRVEPAIKLGDLTTLKLAVSGGHFDADLPTIGSQGVTRFAVDGTVVFAGLTVWGEYTRQWGRHVVDFPIAPVTNAAGDIITPGRSGDRADYAMIGGEYTWDRFTFRYNYNLGSYNVGVKEVRHIPGIAVSFDEHLFVIFEYAYERRYLETGSTLLGSSFNLTFHGKV